VTITAADSPGLWEDRPDSRSPPSAFAAALAVAAAIHMLILLGVGFEMPEAKNAPITTRPLEVVVLRRAAPVDEKPDTADAFAQVDREGGGIEEVVEELPEPAPEPFAFTAEPASEGLLESPLPPPIPQSLETAETSPPQFAEGTTLSAMLEVEPLKPAPPEAETIPEPEVMPEPEPLPPPVSAAQIMASRNLEIAQLSARIQEQSSAYSKRERRKAISASTREYKYASYLEAWRRKVERIGNLNYPEEAKKHKLYGTLILHVAVRADGSVERIRVLRSSGFDVLDQAAVKIVELAAPFAPLPPDIKAETDILDITRTWQFLRSNRLGWDN